MYPDLLIDALGATVRITAAALPPTDRAQLAALWAGAASTTAGRRPPTDIELPDTSDFQAMLSDLSPRVTLAALSARRGRAWLLHAGAVCDEDGRVIVFVGPSGAGKTTAVATLARTWGYVSDESVAVEDDGAVRAYRKPLSVVQPDTTVKIQVAPAEFGLGQLPSAPLRLAGIAVLDRRSNLTPARVHALDPADALVHLTEQSSYLSAMRQPLATILRHLSETGGAHRLVYDDVAHLPGLVASLFAAAPSAPAHTGRAAIPSRVRHAEGRAGVVDAIELVDGRVVVLTPATHDRPSLSLRVLSPAAGAAWWHSKRLDLEPPDIVAALEQHGLLLPVSRSAHTLTAGTTAH